MKNAAITISVNKPTDIWFGDPCYVYPQEAWQDFCKEFEKEIGEERGAAIFDDVDKLLVMSTACGDGDYQLYRDADHVGSALVDSGLLAFIPLDFIENWDGDTSLGIVLRDFTGTVTDDAANCNWCGGIECITDGSDIDEGDGWNEDDDFDDEDYDQAA
ncbi:hypothetical protein [Mesorhizobium sp. A623]